MIKESTGEEEEGFKEEAETRLQTPILVSSSSAALFLASHLSLTSLSLCFQLNKSPIPHSTSAGILKIFLVSTLLSLIQSVEERKEYLRTRQKSRRMNCYPNPGLTLRLSFIFW